MRVTSSHSIIAGQCSGKYYDPHRRLLWGIQTPRNCTLCSGTTKTKRRRDDRRLPNHPVDEFQRLSMTSRRFTAAVSADLRRSQVRRASYNGNKILWDSWEPLFPTSTLSNPPAHVRGNITTSLYTLARERCHPTRIVRFEIRASKRTRKLTAYKGRKNRINATRKKILALREKIKFSPFFFARKRDFNAVILIRDRKLYTLLLPGQARSVRVIGEREVIFEELSVRNLNTTRAAIAKTPFHDRERFTPFEDVIVKLDSSLAHNVQHKPISITAPFYDGW